jgi:hypothetical protein
MFELTTENILSFLLLYAIQSTMAALLNSACAVRIPKSIWDFIKLTFLPYSIYNIIKELRNV